MNVQLYVERRARTAFLANSALTGDALAAALQEGEAQLAVLQRQSVITSLYPPAETSVLDTR